MKKKNLQLTKKLSIGKELIAVLSIAKPGSEAIPSCMPECYREPVEIVSCMPECY